jgi:hypothetical protein
MRISTGSAVHPLAKNDGKESIMLGLMFAALIDTAIAVADPGTVYVHEWGAVTFTQEQVFFGTAPLEGDIPPTILPDHWDEPLARAPVVYFYGAPFSGVFRVGVSSGAFVEAVPDPTTLSDTRPMPMLPESYTAEWRLSGDLEGPASSLRETGYIDCIPADLMESWRMPPSHVLQFGDGTSEKFVYYECALTPTDSTSFSPVLFTDGDARLEPGYQGRMVRFSRSDGTVSAELVEAGLAVRRVSLTEDSPEMVEILCDWAEGGMKTAELQAMWDTWSGWVKAGDWEGDELMMFPFPSQTVEGMTTIQLTTDQMLRVEYTRFFVGFVSGETRSWVRLLENAR